MVPGKQTALAAGATMKLQARAQVEDLISSIATSFFVRFNARP
jgi:hypothetical protein